VLYLKAPVLCRFAKASDFSKVHRPLTRIYRVHSASGGHGQGAGTEHRSWDCTPHGCVRMWLTYPMLRAKVELVYARASASRPRFWEGAGAGVAAALRAMICFDVEQH